MRRHVHTDLFKLTSFTATAVLLFLFVAGCGRDNGSVDPNDPSGRNVNTGNASVPLSTVKLMDCPASGTVDISMQDQKFVPDSVTVPVNTVIKWTNNGGGENWWVISSEVPENGAFKIAPFGYGRSECAKFTAPGSYNYHCNPDVTGVVIVQ